MDIQLPGILVYGYICFGLLKVFTLANRYYCSVCSKLIRANSNAIFCDLCELWSHPICNQLNTTDFQNLANSNPNMTWSCIKCNTEIFPFPEDSTSNVNSSNLQFHEAVNSTHFNSLSDIDEEKQATPDCEYYEVDLFNSSILKYSKSNLKTSLSLFHFVVLFLET